MPCTPFGSDAVVIVKTRLTVMVSDFCAVCTPSVTWAVKVDAPLPVGVPLITPAADKLSPTGNAPDASDHVFVPVPPVAVKVWEYVVPWTPFGNDAVVKRATPKLLERFGDLAFLVLPPPKALHDFLAGKAW